MIFLDYLLKYKVQAGDLSDFSQSAFIIIKTKSVISLTPLQVSSFCLSVP